MTTSTAIARPQIDTEYTLDHKYSRGHLLLHAGAMAGAAVLAASAARRVGAGLVTVLTDAERTASALVSYAPGTIVAAEARWPELLADPRMSPVLIGPGAGRSEATRTAVIEAAGSGKPLVLDADGLNMLAAGRAIAAQRRDNWVLTPHPGEAGRLLHTASAEVQAERFAAARALWQRYGGAVVLKGSGSLIAGDGQLLLSDYGNPGMASGGMGDVLSGVIGALLAQHVPLPEAAALGVCLHGAAADAAAQQGQRGLAATDLMPQLRALLG